MKKLMLVCLMIPTMVLGQNHIEDIPKNWKPNISDVMVQVRKLSKHPSQSSLDLAHKAIQQTDAIVEDVVQQAQKMTSSNPRVRARKLNELYRDAEKRLSSNAEKIKNEVALHIEEYEHPMTRVSKKRLMSQRELAEKIEEKSSENSRIAKILSVHFTPTYVCQSHGVTAGFLVWVGGSVGASRVVCHSLNGDSMTNNTLDLGLGAGAGVKAGYTNQVSCQVGELSEANRAGGWGVSASIVAGGMVGGSQKSRDLSALGGVIVGVFGTKSFALNDPKISHASEQQNVDLYLSPDAEIQEKVKSVLSASMIERTECGTQMAAVRDGDRLGAKIDHASVISQADVAKSNHATLR